ncbi:MAG TPA: hypothetical protein V6C65_03765 [Allocoleopsis sp.]
MNTQRYRQQNNTLLLIVSLFGIMAFAAFLLVLAAYLTQTPRETVAAPPTVSPPPTVSQPDPTPVKAPNKPVQAVSAPPSPQTPIKPETAPIGPIVAPTVAPTPLLPPPKPTDPALELFAGKVTAYLEQCRVLNKLLGNSPSLSDYKREHEIANGLFVRIPEEVPASIKPEQARIIKRTLADLDQLSDIDEITIFQRDKCLLNAAEVEEEGNEQLATKFRVVAGSCEESLSKNIDHRKKLMGFVENALAEGKN